MGAPTTRRRDNFQLRFLKYRTRLAKAISGFASQAPANSRFAGAFLFTQAAAKTRFAKLAYVTKREDAVRWLSLLRTQAKLRRIDCFHGSTPDATRQDILNLWASNRIDGIVATSAFGVGIDKSDVRTVVHATVPETLDRFYQEVGRGGRDGCSSASLLVHEPADWLLPERLAKPKLISDELGLNRWKSLYASRIATEVPGLFKVYIDAVPEHQRGGNDYNVGWNMRTLLLMCRAGIITLDVTDKVEPTQDTETPSFLAAMSAIQVRVLNDGHLLPSVWETIIRPCREATYRSGSNSLRFLKDMLVGNREVSSTLAETFKRHVARPFPGLFKERT